MNKDSNYEHLNRRYKMYSLRKNIIFSIFLLYSSFIMAQNWDIALLKDINRKQSPGSTTFFKLTSNSAYLIPFAYPVVCFTIGKINKNNPLVRESFYSSISLSTASLLSYTIKIVGKRPRPYDAYPNQLRIDKPANTYSFPSGHTTVAFCAATSMSLYYKKWYVAVPAYAWACSIAYSRMYLGKHYPTDIIGGILLGTGIPLLLHFCKPVNLFVDRVGKGLLNY